jgi:hypothetical protein
MPADPTTGVDPTTGPGPYRLMTQLELMMRIEDEALLARGEELDLLAYRACQLAENLVELARRASPPTGPPGTVRGGPVNATEAA